MEKRKSGLGKEILKLSSAGKLAALGAIGAAGVLGTIGIKYLTRFIVDKVHDNFLEILTSQLYDENLWEASSTMRWTTGSLKPITGGTENW